MKKVLVSGYIGFDNFGDEAIFYALQKHLKELDFSISAICNNPEKIKKQYNINVCYYKDIKQIIFLDFHIKCLIFFIILELYEY